MRVISALAFVLWVFAGNAVQAQQPAAKRTATTAATTRPLARPDPHLWTQRNLDLIRAGTARADEPKGSDAIGTALGFSLTFNPLLVRDPYAQEMLEIIETALADDQTHEEARAVMEEFVPFLRLPEDQRVLRQLSRHIEAEDMDKPLLRAGNELNVASDLGDVMGLEAYEPLTTRAIEQLNAAARAAGRERRLALAYSHLAHSALRRGLRERTDLYIDRMLAIVREQPDFQIPQRGNTNAVSPSGVALLLFRAGRAEDFDALLKSVDAQVRVELLIGAAAAHANEDRLDDARRVIETELRLLAPAAAGRLLAALDRDNALTAPVTSMPSAPSSTRPSDRNVDPAEQRLREAVSSIVRARIRREDPAHVIERALEALRGDPTHSPQEVEEKTRFVREALQAQDVELAQRMLQTSSQPGAYWYYQLAKAQRARGNAARANELVEQALVIAGKGRGGGSVMADIAVDLHAAGKVERAEELLTRAIDHIEGVDFGLGGTAAIVQAAMRMNRLDLLDRFYETYELGERMLLCIMATRAGFFPTSAAAEEDDE